MRGLKIQASGGNFGVPLYPSGSSVADSIPIPTTDLYQWFKADAITGLSDGNLVTTWADSSGNSRDATQSTATNQPSYQTNEINGLPVVRFDGVDNFFTLPTMAALTAAEYFIVVRLVQATPDPVNAGLWDIGSDFVNPTIFPFVVDGNIYDQFGTTSRKTTGNPVPSFQNWNIYSVISVTNEWTNFFNGTQLFTTGTNTVGFSATPTLGKSGGHGSGDFYLEGDVPEMIGYSAKLSADDRASVLSYLTTKYAL